jgi:hypothetical protein
VVITYGSGSRLISRLISKRVSDFVHETFESEDVLQELAFVAFVVGHSACCVQLKSHTSAESSQSTNEQSQNSPSQQPPSTHQP